MILCVHGSRPDKWGGYNQPNLFSQYVANRIKDQLIGMNPSKVLLGGDLGVPQWTATICSELGYPYEVIVPFKDFSTKWPPNARAVFLNICAKADHVHVVSPTTTYTSGAIYRRNEYMVKMSDEVLLFWDGSPGVTEHVHNTALGRQKKITTVSLPDDLRVQASQIYMQLQQKKAALTKSNIQPQWPKFNPIDSEQEIVEKQYATLKAMGFMKQTQAKVVDPWGLKEEDAPAEEREPETLGQRLAPKRVVEID
jgi:uncharacterized phage-like protein YoqJ